MESLKLTVIKTKNAGLFLYIGEVSIYDRNRFAANYLFDGVHLENSNNERFFRIKELPKKITTILPTVYKNCRYELKEMFQESNLTPKVIYRDSANDFEQVLGLYDYKHDAIGGEEIEVSFECDILDEEIDFFIENPKFKFTISLLDQLTINPALHQNKKCKIDSKQLYNIVRDYIKKNINNKIAYISSDYDFCFSVNKHIELHKPEKYKVDNGTKRRPNLVEKQRIDKTIQVFQSCPEAYQSYTVQEPIFANNYAELEQKVNDYLENLINKINEPLVECSHCKGHGVITKN